MLDARYPRLRRHAEVVTLDLTDRIDIHSWTRCRRTRFKRDVPGSLFVLLASPRHARLWLVSASWFR